MDANNNTTYKYPTVESMYAEDDLGNDPIFPGNFINYGYWKNIEPSTPITLNERLQSQADLYRLMFSQAEISKEDIVLEVGCGRGQGLKLLSEEVMPASIYGVDFSEHQVQRSRSNLVGISNVTVTQAPAEELPFEAGTFTKAYSVEAIQHFKSPEVFIQQLSRVLKEGGKVAITSFFATDRDSIPTLKEMFPTLKRGVDNAIDIHDMSTWLEKNGLVDIKVSSIGSDVWSYFVEWCNQVKPEEVSTNWLEAFQKGLMDYYVITGVKV